MYVQSWLIFLLNKLFTNYLINFIPFSYVVNTTTTIFDFLTKLISNIQIIIEIILLDLIR